MRFRVDQAADSSVFSRNLRLHSAPRVVVLRNHNRALHGDAEPVKFLVVLRQPVVHKDQGRGYIAVDRIRVVGGQLFRLLIRGGIDRQRRLFKLGGELRRLDHLQHPHLRRGKEHVEGFDVRVQSPFLET